MYTVCSKQNLVGHSFAKTYFLIFKTAFVVFCIHFCFFSLSLIFSPPPPLAQRLPQTTTPTREKTYIQGGKVKERMKLRKSAALLWKKREHCSKMCAYNIKKVLQSQYKNNGNYSLKKNEERKLQHKLFRGGLNQVSFYQLHSAFFTFKRKDILEKPKNFIKNQHSREFLIFSNCLH